MEKAALSKSVAGAITPDSISTEPIRYLEPKSSYDTQDVWAGPEYLPRSMLSVAPTPQTSIVVPYPPEVAGSGRYVGVFSLFIDELGGVRHVRMEDSELPPAMEEAVRQTFLQIQFSSGERDGQHVKSHIRIEVVFDII
jgi:hypothetical protein